MKKNLLRAVVGGFILCLALSADSPRRSHAARPDCRDTFIRRVESPDGTLAVYLYHRDCASAFYTYAKLHTQPTSTMPEGDEVCQLVTLRGRLKIAAVWKDPKHILISSPDRLSWDLGVSSKQDSCNDFSEGMARISTGYEGGGKNQKYGYIDTSGEVRIEPQFESASEFHEGMAYVETEFSEGLAAVQHKKGLGGYPQWGFVDTSGRIVIQPQYDHVKDFTEGMALVSTRERGLGYIDRRGRYVWGPFH